MANAASISLEELKLFYYEAYELQFDEDEKAWEAFEPWSPTEVVVPISKKLEGFDIASATMGNIADFAVDGGERTVDEVNPAQGNTRIDSTGRPPESILSPERRRAHWPDGRQGARHVLWPMFPPSPPSYIDRRVGL